MSSLPLVMSPAGALPATASAVRSALVAAIAAQQPGFTANLPGTLIEDIVSTDVAAIVQMDQARVDAINSITPYGANAFVLAQLGAQFGIAQGVPTNTSVYVVFSGTPGYVIPPGFLVSDGTYAYSVQDGGVIGSGGSSATLYCVAVQPGTWVVPAASVTQIVTSVPGAYAVTCTNPVAGVPSAGAESVDSFRGRVINAVQSMAQGVATYLLSQLQSVPGVNPRLVSVIQAPGGWEVICGGGDPVQVAGAIYRSVLDLSTIVGSTTTARNISATLIDTPNTYNIVYVTPPQQALTMSVTWATNQSGFASGQSVNQLAAAALTNYINSIQVGMPINELDMIAVFQTAVASVLPSQYIVALTFSASINGTPTPPNAGTTIIPGDPESYFFAADGAITVAQ